MMDTENITKMLIDKGIKFELIEHKPVYTIEDMLELDLDKKGTIIMFQLLLHKKAPTQKNRLLSNETGREHYLFILKNDRMVSVKELQKLIGSTNLSFASEERLKKHLGLEKGAVTPFGVFNDKEKHVVVYFDSALENAASIGFHPNVNTATLYISFKDIYKLLLDNCTDVRIIKL